MKPVLIALVLGACLAPGCRPADVQADRMVRVEAGSFLMGDATGLGYPDERPAHAVRLSAFLISRTELTQAEWIAVMGEKYLPASVRGDRLPVDLVGWRDALDYCNRLSLAEGLSPAYDTGGPDPLWNRRATGYRLPTEAEWEYAARGGLLSRGYPYSGGARLDEVGWYNANSGIGIHPVGQKSPNELGLHDMSGNAWEWCWDWYGDYTPDGQTDPEGPPNGVVRQGQGAAPTTGPVRQSRGGSWSYDAFDARVSSRFFAPDYRLGTAGLRLARSLP